MNTTIRSAIKQALTAPGFLIGILGVVVVLVFSCIEGIVDVLRSEDLLTYGWHGMQIISAIRSNAFLMTLPIWASLPYTSSFCDELKSGFTKLYLHRTTTSRYLFSKIIACILSGGLVLAVGIFVTYGLFAIVFTPMEAVKAAETQNFVTVIKSIPNIFFSGALWAVVGMLFSSVTGSKYIAYASPFITYYLLIIIYERYLTKLHIISPHNWILKAESLPLGNFGAVILIWEITAVLSALFWGVGERRLKRL